MVVTPLKLYGWMVSPYTAKVRAYLKYKAIPFREIAPSLLGLRLLIKPKVGQAIMPVVRLPNGEWLQDSSDIIDALETQHPTPALEPEGPRQALVSSLFELHADEWLPMAALHYRWNVPKNAKFAVSEFAAMGAPFLPAFIARPILGGVARRMQSYLPMHGVRSDTEPAVEAFVHRLIRLLNTHLESLPYLLGGRPCLGDFSLFGPLWAHLYRDPASTALFDEAPHVLRWLTALAHGAECEGEFVAGDEVPATLLPLLRPIFDDQLPWIQTLEAAIHGWCEAHPDAGRVPRALGMGDGRLGQTDVQRRLITFTQWKAQRSWSAYASRTESERASLDRWLQVNGLKNAFQTPIRHPFTRVGFQTRLAQGTTA